MLEWVPYVFFFFFFFFAVLAVEEVRLVGCLLDSKQLLTASIFRFSNKPLYFGEIGRSVAGKQAGRKGTPRALLPWPHI